MLNLNLTERNKYAGSKYNVVLVIDGHPYWVLPSADTYCLTAANDYLPSPVILRHEVSNGDHVRIDGIRYEIHNFALVRDDLANDEVTITSVVFRRSDSRKPRIYVWVNGENVMENLVNRFSRPYKMYKMLVLPMLLEELGAKDAKVRWSQKAGCSCGCSPAFIATGLPFNQDIHVEVTGNSVAVDDDTADIAADRAAQLGLFADEDTSYVDWVMANSEVK